MSSTKINFSQFYKSPITDGRNVFKDSFTFTVDKNTEDIFQILSNTSLINKKLNFAPRIESEVDGEVVVETKMIGKNLKWIEKPWRWSYGKYIVSHRIHEHSLFKAEFAVIHIEANAKKVNHSDITFYYEAEVKNILMKWILELTYQGFGKKYQKVVQEICHSKITPEVGEKNPLSLKLQGEFEELGITVEVASHMANLIIEGDDDDVFKIQLPKLSKEWGVETDELIPSFLKASKANYFDLCWDTVCPHCKGARSRSGHLEDLLFQNHCEPCSLTFELDDIDFIDVSFKINDNLRKVPEVNFCAAEPHKKAHIYLQEKLDPKDNLELEYELEHGNYRLRVLGFDNTFVLQVISDEVSTLSWNLAESQVLKGQGGKLKIGIMNSNSSSRSIIFEKIAPPPFYLSPLEVFNSPCFRKLYASETIAKGIQLKLPAQIILFTDVVDSTKFYQRVGDIEAYRQIKLHFEIVEAVLEKRKGIIIKTIGDAVMASFPSVVEVLNAAKEICENLNNHPEIDFKIRLSVHKGPMIAVNYNTGIDYFGDNVNLSAKLQAISEGDEISFSKELLKDVELSFPKTKFSQRTYLETRIGYMAKVCDIK
ncbi:MAG: hypothetical protein ACJAS4_000449 [Bacteriovoracaceae bacterium]|jgi:hypothetical protein